MAQDISAPSNPLIELGKENNNTQFGLRNDGTPKGKGFFGLLKRPDGRMASEISVGVEFDGKEIEIPTLVPTLSKKEVEFLVNDWKEGVKVPEPIMRKAVNHALMRMKQGLSPFAD